MNGITGWIVAIVLCLLLGAFLNGIKRRIDIYDKIDDLWNLFFRKGHEPTQTAFPQNRQPYHQTRMRRTNDTPHMTREFPSDSEYRK